MLSTLEICQIWRWGRKYTIVINITMLVFICWLRNLSLDLNCALLSRSQLNTPQLNTPQFYLNKSVCHFVDVILLTRQMPSISDSVKVKVMARRDQLQRQLQLQLWLGGIRVNVRIGAGVRVEFKVRVRDMASYADMLLLNKLTKLTYLESKGAFGPNPNFNNPEKL